MLCTSPKFNIELRNNVDNDDGEAAPHADPSSNSTTQELNQLWMINKIWILYIKKNKFNMRPMQNLIYFTLDCLISLLRKKNPSH